MKQKIFGRIVVALLISGLGLSVVTNGFAVPSKKDVRVGAYYYIWWGLPTSYPNHWKEGVKYTPFLGEYNSRDQLTADRHILWAKQHGIDFFAVSWLGNWDWYDHRYIDQHNLKNAFLKAKQLSEFKFCLFYESEIVLNAALDAGENFTQIFINDMVYAAQQYFTHPSYLQVNGKPVLFIYNLPYIYDKLGNTSTRNLFDNLRQRISVYLVGDVGRGPSPNDINPNLLYSMNAVTSYFFSDPSKGWQKILEEAENYYPKWCSMMNPKRISFVPNAYPGFDNTAQNKSNSVILSPNETKFKKMLNTALINVDNNLKIVMVTSWNEWLESTMIEPSMEFGELFLHAVLEAKNQLPLRECNVIYFVVGGFSGVIATVIFYYLKSLRKCK